MALSLIDFFDNGVAIDPDRACLICGDDTLTYGEAQRNSYRLADALARAGVASGMRAAVLGPNSNRAFECVLGVLRAGATWVPVNARNAVEETVYVLNHTDAEVLFYSVLFVDQVSDLLVRCPAIRLAVCIDGDGIDGHPSVDSLCAGASEARRELLLDPDALATLACSGGTTGFPKGVMTSHRTWAFRIAEVMQRLAHPAPVNLVAAPMTHGAGAGALEMMAMGAVHIVQPGFDAAAIVEAIGRYGVTHMFLPPTALYRLLAEPTLSDGDFTSLRYLICGGAPISPDRIREAASVFGEALHVGYGGTEFGGGVCWMTGAAIADAIARGDERRLLSCGRPSPLARVDIVGEGGRILPPGETGEIVVSGYVVASGYYKNPEETAQAYRADGFYTGDIGSKDADGWIHISDRRKDMIISGGFNVYPSEVERILMMHPAVQDCAVVGMADPHWGEAVTAVIEPKAGMTVEEAELTALCRAHLAGYKTPKSIHIWQRLPRSPVGKVLKRAIRDGLAKGKAA